jgi:endonuclease/exonuclease/phosphatase family metal-dependent hydrolase
MLLAMRLRVATYNIHRAIGVDRLFRPDRVVTILEHHDPDLVLLQEVDDGAPRSREMDLGRDIATALGYPHVAIGHNVALRRGRYGNATLSRYPILRQRNIDLTVGRRKRRGCQHTRIAVAVPRRRMAIIEVFNLHLGLSAREREQQLGLLVSSPEFASLGRDANCLLAGDFNDWRARLVPSLTGPLGFQGARDGRPGHEHAVATYPSFFPRGALDLVFYRGRLRLRGVRRCRLGVARVASDHLPLIADFEV